MLTLLAVVVWNPRFHRLYRFLVGFKEVEIIHLGLQNTPEPFHRAVAGASAAPVSYLAYWRTGSPGPYPVSVRNRRVLSPMKPTGDIWERTSRRSCAGYPGQTVSMSCPAGFCTPDHVHALFVRKRAQLFRVQQQSRDTVLTNGIPALKTYSVFDGCVVCHRPQSLDFACCFSHPYRSLALYFIRPEDGLRLLRCLRAPLRRAILLICLFRERDANDSGTGVGSNGGADLVE